MLKAKLDSARKNKKGFSLIELIIVVAIMVALIAVLAPSYVKYVQKSRDAALATAAEDFSTAVKTYYADPDCEEDLPTAAVTYTLKVGTNGLECNDLAADSKLAKFAGIEIGKKMGKTGDEWTVTINTSGSVELKQTVDK